MKIFGFEVTRTKAAGPLASIPGDRGNWWWPIVREPFTGAWQRNQEIRVETALVYSAVYACVTLISSDIAKIGLRLVEKDDDDIWNEVSVSAFSPVLRKPNHYQTRIKFIEQWVLSKLIYGNTYVLKERDARNVVVAMHVLDPMRTKPLVAPDGSVLYQLSTDALSGIEENSVKVPASEIIHDRMKCLYHPLCGISPLTACGIAAMQGLAIQNNSTKFFENGSQPGGVLSAPGSIDDTTAKRLKDYWESNYTGSNAGRIAVLGDGLKYEAMAIPAVDSQLIEQLKWTAETVCSVFHIPPYMIGVGAMPAYNNIEALNQQYYSQCLQELIENIEALLDEGLGLVDISNHDYGIEFDLDDLLRMDTATKVKSWQDLVRGGIASPNEARLAFNLAPVDGGNTPYLQQQNYSLAALDKRDAKDDPFSSGTKPAVSAAPAASDGQPVPQSESQDAPPADASAAFLGVLARAALDFKSMLHGARP